MLKEIAAVFDRSSATLLEDSIGVAGLFSLLIAALCLPGLV
ncbi:hypothetical protein [Fertoeibacter niger]|nr:hypothetical protein [Fertoeibacter niger]